ncbi:glycosyltransferase [Maribacter algicola]|uniref:Glycosyltransferase n=1 Tax=Meishania litoralis TaxID=3434685 RepID=A0ACC7LH49_9FLAO
MTDLKESIYSFDDIVIVLVLYRTVLEDCNSFITLVRNVRHGEKIDLLVYDNSPVKQQRPASLEHQGIKLHYISDTSNPGIGKAYNTAIRFAREKEKKWVLFLDQDTQIAPEMLQLYLDAINVPSEIRVFATTLYGNDGRLISPSKYRFKRGFRLENLPKGKVSLKKIRPINSLLLLSVEVFETVGKYNEEIRLDFSDHEFLGRVEKYYNEMYVVPAHNGHSLSSSDDRDMESIRSRFVIFCKGAHVAAGTGFISRLQYFMVCLLRALKLSIKSRSLFFLKVMFKEWLGRA